MLGFGIGRQQRGFSSIVAVVMANPAERMPASEEEIQTVSPDDADVELLDGDEDTPEIEVREIEGAEAADLRRMQSAALEEVDQVATAGVAEAQGDAAATEAIQESAEEAERAIAEATREVRKEWATRVRKEAVEQGDEWSYEPPEIPELEVLENELPANDNARKELKKVIESERKSLHELDEKDGLSDKEKAKRAVLQRGLSFHEKMNEKEELVRRLEDQAKQYEKMQKKVAAAERKIQDIEDGVIEGSKEAAEKDLEKLKKQRLNVVSGMEANRGELFAMGLALTNLDRLLSVAKKDLKEEEEKEAREREDELAAKDREREQQAFHEKKLDESSRSEDWQGVKKAGRWFKKKAKAGASLGGAVGVLGVAGLFRGIWKAFSSLPDIFHALDKGIKFLFGSLKDKVIFWGKFLTFDPKENPIADWMINGRKEKKDKKKKK